MGLPIANPEELGLDGRRLSVADSLIQAGHELGIYSAATLAVARRGRLAHLAAFGTLAPGAEATRPDTIFDLASLTKPIVAAALLALVEEGRLTLSQELREWVPETQDKPLGPVPLRLLATHVSGLPPWKPLYKAVLSPDEPLPQTRVPPPDARHRILAEICAAPLHAPPGTRYAYSDLGYILLGEVIARASGLALDEYVKAMILAPLGMKDAGYRPAPEMRERVAATANSARQGERPMIGEVHDDNAFALGGVAGHAGLFGTAPDLAIFAAALAGNGEASGHRILGLPTLRLVRTNQVAPAIGGHSIGWFTPPNSMLPRGDILSDDTFGHTGFTGTMIVCDPSLELAIVLLTNRVINPADNGGIARIRRRVLNVVASAVIS